VTRALRPRPFFGLLLAGVGAVVLAAGTAQLGGQRERLPEHALYDRWLGTWEARVTVEVPGVGAVESTGTERNRLGPGGRWLATEQEYELLGTLYEGSGWLNYHPHRLEWVSVWIDGVDDALKVGVGSWDEASSTFTSRREFADARGARVEERVVDRFVSANLRELEVWTRVDGGEPDLGVSIRLQRH
jgi:hypothetical protein